MFYSSFIEALRRAERSYKAHRQLASALGSAGPREYVVTVTRNLPWFDARHKEDVHVTAYDAADAVFQAQRNLRGPKEWLEDVQDVRPAIDD